MGYGKSQSLVHQGWVYDGGGGGRARGRTGSGAGRSQSLVHQGWVYDLYWGCAPVRAWFRALQSQSLVHQGWVYDLRGSDSPAGAGPRDGVQVSIPCSSGLGLRPGQVGEGRATPAGEAWSQSLVHQGWVYDGASSDGHRPRCHHGLNPLFIRAGFTTNKITLDITGVEPVIASQSLVHQGWVYDSTDASWKAARPIRWSQSLVHQGWVYDSPLSETLRWHFIGHQHHTLRKPPCQGPCRGFPPTGPQPPRWPQEAPGGPSAALRKPPPVLALPGVSADLPRARRPPKALPARSEPPPPVTVLSPPRPVCCHRRRLPSPLP